MKKFDFAKITGVDKLLCGVAGGVIGFILGGVIPMLLGGFVGILVGYVLQKDLEKIKI